MSEINNFSDYASKYNTNVDYRAFVKIHLMQLINYLMTIMLRKRSK